MGHARDLYISIRFSAFRQNHRVGGLDKIPPYLCDRVLRPSPAARRALLFRTRYNFLSSCLSPIVS
jgi:hypothetical protein